MWFTISSTLMNSNLILDQLYHFKRKYIWVDCFQIVSVMVNYWCLYPISVPLWFTVSYFTHMIIFLQIKVCNGKLLAVMSSAKGFRQTGSKHNLESHSLVDLLRQVSRGFSNVRTQITICSSRCLLFFLLQPL